MLGGLVNVETRAGDSIQAGDVTLVPMAKLLVIKFPRLRGGIIWNRPASVVARFADGHEQVLPIRDVTRQAQLALLGGSLITAFFVWLMMRRKRLK